MNENPCYENIIKINIPDIHFDSYITMPSSDFQTYISDLSNISSEIEIKTNSDNMVMTAKGDFAEQSITINETNDKVTDKKNENNFILEIKTTPFSDKIMKFRRLRDLAKLF